MWIDLTRPRVYHTRLFGDDWICLDDQAVSVYEPDDWLTIEFETEEVLWWQRTG